MSPFVNDVEVVIQIKSRYVRFLYYREKHSIVSKESKNFILDYIRFYIFSRSLMHIRNNKGPRTEPCGTPDPILEYCELKLLRTTRCFLLLNNRPDIPFCSSLNIKPLCHTLSKALDMSRNTALTSRDSVQSNAR